jgi:hypothetical protein
MKILLTTLKIGKDTSTYDLYSDVDSYITSFETLTKAQLEVGYFSDLVPIGTTIIRVVSIGVCNNSIDIPITGL